MTVRWKSNNGVVSDREVATCRVRAGQLEICTDEKTGRFVPVYEDGKSLNLPPDGTDMTFNLKVPV